MKPDGAVEETFDAGGSGPTLSHQSIRDLRCSNATERNFLKDDVWRKKARIASTAVG